MKKLLILLSFCVAIPSLSTLIDQDSCFAQTGEFEEIYIEGSTPLLIFDPNGGNRSWFLKFPDKLVYLNSSGTPNVSIHDSAPKAAFTVTDDGFGVGTFDPATAMHIYSDDDASQGYGTARILVENNKNFAATRQMLDLVNNGPVSLRMIDDQSGTWSFVGGHNGQLQMKHDAVPSLTINDQNDQETAGFVGIGTNIPQRKLHVYSGSLFHDAGVIVENRTPVTQLRTMFELVNNGPSSFEFKNTDSDQTWSFQTNASDNFMINRLGSGGNEFSIRKNGMVTMGPGGKINFRLAPNGNLQIAGTVSEASDRNAKEAFQQVDTADVLKKVSELPITTWRYKDETEDIRHMGPMAQDFHKAFGLGESDTTITSVDRSGVALAAIQALNEKLEAELQDKEDRIAQLEQQLAEVIAMMEQRP